MCLAKAFMNNWSEQPVFRDFARLRIYNGKVELETLFGEEKAIQGRVIEVDFAASKILLGKADESDNEG